MFFTTEETELLMFTAEETEMLLQWLCDDNDEHKNMATAAASNNDGNSSPCHQPPTSRAQDGASMSQQSIDSSPTTSPRSSQVWSAEEHERFLSALKRYPNGPWKQIAALVGTRTTRQTRSHAQKHKQKLERQRRKMERVMSYPLPPWLADKDPEAQWHSLLAPRDSQVSTRHGLPWTQEEHERFLAAWQQFPQGPWRLIATHVGTRTIRQVMTHAQKYRQKVARRRQRQQHRPHQEHIGAVEASSDSEGSSSSSPPCSPSWSEDSGSGETMTSNLLELMDDDELHAIMDAAAFDLDATP